MDRLLRDGRKFSPSETADILSSVASALDHAHSRRVIHRDVKPSNLFITDNGVVKVTDFGIAKMPLVSLTGEGRIVGSPSYMSPEAVRGEKVDARSDVFSMGVVLYILLTSKKPFGGGEVPQIIYRIVHEEAPPPSTINTTLDKVLDEPVLRALAKDPAKRYKSAGKLMEAFRDSVSRIGEQLPYIDIGEDSSSTGEMRRPLANMDRYREESSDEGPSKIDRVFHDITSEIRSEREKGISKKKRKKRR